MLVVGDSFPRCTERFLDDFLLESLVDQTELRRLLLLAGPFYMLAAEPSLGAWHPRI